MREQLLRHVQKPTRYTGGEWGSVMKNKEEIDIRFAFCFPDTYEIGMSYPGMQILYFLMNSRPDTWCERVFAPAEDMEKLLREKNIPLFALESGDSVRDFDLLGFTLQYEMSFTNILNMLELAGIPLLSKDRGEDVPVVCAGGPCACNPEPLADFIDFFIMGEGEEVNLEVLEVYGAWKKSGGTKRELLEQLARLEGIYVPAFYDVVYNEDGTIKSFAPNCDAAPKRVRKRIIKDFNTGFTPEQLIVPYGDIVHDRAVLELFRGCIRGCRFCQAGMLYRPVREKTPENLLKTAQKLLSSTGYEEMSMSSLSTSDYTRLRELTDGLLALTEPKMIGLSLPSLRIDNFSMDLMQRVQKVRKSGLTFAPEAGTQRMRNVINKNVTEEDVMRSAEIAFRGGYSSMKLYFMIGLPTETEEDCRGIGELASRVVDVYHSIPKPERPKGLGITISVSSFVPKPFTPFQWAAQDSMASLREKQQTIKGSIRAKAVRYTYHESTVSVLEGAFARGDRRLGKVLLTAHEKGCKFDAWSETFHPEWWDEAFSENGLSIDWYQRARGLDEILPWDFVDIGVTKQFLLNEYEKALRGQTTPDCRTSCSACGAACFGGGVCFEH